MDAETSGSRFVLKPGVYPAAVTPFDARGRVDMAGVARLLAWFDAAGCKGAVLAGTNGEGPSLSAVEKRDLIREAMPLRGKLDLLIGIATSSLEEAVWLCNQASRDGAGASLVMPPSYFKEASVDGIEGWFLTLMDRVDLPVVIYNFPQRTGVTLSPDTIKRLADHARFAGLKDSSGDRENLAGYALALEGREKVLYVGNETLLIEALRHGWTGTISGAANVIPVPLCRIASDWCEDRKESAGAKFELALPAIQAVRAEAQPAMNKAVLAEMGVIPLRDVRLPLTSPDIDKVDALQELIRARLGDMTKSACA